MKVLHIVSHYHRNRAEEMIWPLSSRVTQLEQHSAFISPAEPLVRGKNNHWIEAHSLSSKKCYKSLSNLSKEVHPDVVHVHGMDVLPVALASFSKKTPLVLSVLYPRSSNWFKKKWERLMDQSIRWVDRVCFSSRALEKQYHGEGLPLKKSRFVFDAVSIPKAVNAREFRTWLEGQRESIRTRPLITIYEGSLKNKTLLAAIKSFEKKFSPAFLLSKGDFDRYRNELKGFPIANLPDRFFLEACSLSSSLVVGALDPVVPVEIYKSLHLGTPILFSMNSDLKDFVNHYDGGFQCHPRRPYDWEMGMRTIQSDFGLREKFKKSNRNMALMKFTVLRWEREMTNIYQEISNSIGDG